MFTRKTFIMVAQLIRRMRAAGLPEEYAVTLEQEFSEVFYSSNPRFDRAKFKEVALGDLEHA